MIIFTKDEAAEEFKILFKDQPELVQEVDFDILPSSLRVNLNNPSDYTLIIERMEGNPAVKEIRASGEAIERLLSLTNTLVLAATVFCYINCICCIYINYQYAKTYCFC